MLEVCIKLTRGECSARLAGTRGSLSASIEASGRGQRSGRTGVGQYGAVKHVHELRPDAESKSFLIVKLRPMLKFSTGCRW